MSDANELPFAHGGPVLRGVMRATPEDFHVDEDLGFELEGSGEHSFVRVEKRGANTDFVARELARFAGVSPDAVSYAGMKDRHAVTRQTFSVHLPGKPDPNWNTLENAEFRILDARRHNRKLKRGALRGNRFVLRLRELAGDRAAAETTLAAIQARGVPNYFGEQRFGRGGDNIDRARAMFAGKRVPRHIQGILLSAARSAIFNAVLAERVMRAAWDQPLDGEVWMLDGSHSVFGPEAFSPELAQRLAAFDIHPTGPMWGRGELRSREVCAEIEQAAVMALPGLGEGLEREGLRQERRSLRLRPEGFCWGWDEGVLELRFGLPAGAYATVVVREVMGVAEGVGE